MVSNIKFSYRASIFKSDSYFYITDSSYALTWVKSTNIHPVFRTRKPVQFYYRSREIWWLVEPFVAYRGQMQSLTLHTITVMEWGTDHNRNGGDCGLRCRVQMR
jgi:hypothetical protein